MTGDYAVLIFHSDDAFQERGFLLVFTAAPIGKWQNANDELKRQDALSREEARRKGTWKATYAFLYN